MTKSSNCDEVREEYDFDPDTVRTAARGKYADRYARGSKLVLLDPDVAEVFPDSASVNRALRALVSIIKERKQPPVK